MLNSYAERIWTTVRFIESFAVHSNTEVEKWVNCIMSEAKKEDLIVLRGAMQFQ